MILPVDFGIEKKPHERDNGNGGMGHIHRGHGLKRMPSGSHRRQKRSPSKG
jgi:hypothetical protein